MEGIRRFAIYTGKKGAYNVDTIMKISFLNKEELEKYVQELRDEMFYLKDEISNKERELNKIKNNWIVKVLIKLNIIKL